MRTTDTEIPQPAVPGPSTDLSIRRGAIIAVGGGKGGIGKSLLASNLGVVLAQAGRRVVLVDADLGGANLHTCLGIPPPRTTLSDFISRQVGSLEEVVTKTPIPRLGLISGALDFLGAANPKYTQKLRLLREISRLDVDNVIIDLGGGTGFNILDFFLVADYGILAIVPEPTSIENAYRFIKAAYYRRLKTADLAWNIRPLVDEALKERSQVGMRTPADLLRYVESRNPEAGVALRQEFDKLPLDLVVNQARSAEEQRLGQAVSDACHKYFGVKLRYLGTIPYDDAVWQAVRHRQPVMLAAPGARASMEIRAIAARLGDRDAEPRQ